jgi:CRISPR-associated protein Csm3
MTNQNHNFNFQGKIIITADIRCVTGLHIGGTEEGFEIGGVDNIVVKDPLTEIPYIPGSSLKGKMRSLLEWAEGRVSTNTKLNEKTNSWECKPCECGKCDVCVIFGSSAASSSKEGPTRLIVRDAYPKGFIKDDGTRNFEAEQIKNWEQTLGEKIYTELKTENVIDRITSAANPRTMERVPADSVFTVEMVFDLYRNDDKAKLKKVFEAMALLEDSNLGGGGSRGSGKIKFEGVKVNERSLDYYQGRKEQNKEIVKDKTVQEILQNFDEFFK